jgi:hypothetical protein
LVVHDSSFWNARRASAFDLCTETVAGVRMYCTSKALTRPCMSDCGLGRAFALLKKVVPVQSEPGFLDRGTERVQWHPGSLSRSRYGRSNSPRPNRAGPRAVPVRDPADRAGQNSALGAAGSLHLSRTALEAHLVTLLRNGEHHPLTQQEVRSPVSALANWTTRPPATPHRSAQYPCANLPAPRTLLQGQGSTKTPQRHRRQGQLNPAEDSGGHPWTTSDRRWTADATVH